MDKTLLRILTSEVARQSNFGLIAASDMDAALSSREWDRFWYSIQSLLIAAGNVSKLLWPSKTPAHERGEALREYLRVPNSSPLKPRSFRNHFEHFDERLEMWATSSKRKNVADSNIGPPNMIAGLDPGDFLRNFDTKEYAVTFRGDTYSLKPVVEALRDVHGSAARESSKAPWES